MSVSSRYILHQGEVLGALARAVLTSSQSSASQSQGQVDTPGPEHRVVVPPRAPDLVRNYVRHVGGDPSTYKRRLPPHFFPQWIFPLVPRTLEGLPYPMAKAMNAGARMEVRAPLPIDEPLHVSAWLDDVDDDGRRAIVRQKAITGTSTHPEALITHFYVFVPLGGGDKSKSDGGNSGGASKKKEKKDKPRVPDNTRELQYWRLGKSAGLDFAKLTGDFNPVHWVPAYARAMGFPFCILHGFSTMARAVEGLNQGLFSGDVDAVRVFEARFTRPLVLPRQVGLYVDAATGGANTPAASNNVYVGDAPGGPAYLVGSYEANRAGSAG